MWRRECAYLALLIVIIVGFTSVTSKKTNEDTLEVVHVLFRHGDRTPDRISVYPKDPYFNETYDPIGYGQLTNEGKRREYKIGRILRNKYRNFLGKYKPNSIDARSTSYNRTKMSLQLVLASLYPPENEELWQRGLKWQPIPYNYWEKEQDMLLAFPRHVCPRFAKEYHKYLHSPECAKRYQKYTKLFEYLTKHTGWNVNTTDLISEMYLTLVAEQDWGFQIPKWANDIYPDVLNVAAVEEYYVRTSNTILRRLSSGFLLKKIIEDTKQKIDGKIPETKLFLYSAHEHNIGSMLATFDYNMTIVPPYGSFMIFEVHKIGTKHGFKIFYQDYQTKRLKPVRVGKCRKFCPYKQFVEMFKNVLPKSEKECIS